LNFDLLQPVPRVDSLCRSEIRNLSEGYSEHVYARLDFERIGALGLISAIAGLSHEEYHK
jgi:hypothetical protein